MTSIKKNYIYNAFYNVLTLILPLATAPYISRIMGAEMIGIYSYSYSIASYFGLFILLGLNNYGNRTIAAVREDKKKLSKTFWSVYIMQICMAIFIILLYVGYIIFIASNKLMASIQLIYLISVAIDINWFFFGLEQFKLTVSRNTIIKIINMIFIFLLIKEKNDLYVYAIIMTLGALLSQSILWLFIRKYITFTKVSINDVVKHIKPNLIMFIPVIAISVYTIMDRVMLGSMSNMSEVGYFESSNKLTTIPAMAITSLGTVMLPRMSNLIANGKKNEAMQYIQKSLIVSVLLSSSMAFGISAVSKEFVPLFYGEGFEKCSLIISTLVISSIFMSWANVIRTQYLIPYQKDKEYILSVILGAIVNVIINLLLIPRYQAFGAAIGTVIAEATVCFFQSYRVKNQIEIVKYFKQSIPFLLFGLIMFLIVYNIPIIINYFITVICKICIGFIIYILLLFVYYYGKSKKQKAKYLKRQRVIINKDEE